MPELLKLFDLPTSKQRDEIATSSNLSDTQKNALGIALCHVKADLEGFFRTRFDRPENAELTARLGEIQNGLKALNAALATDVDVLTQAMPFDMRELVGRLMSPMLIAEVTGRDVGSEAEVMNYASRSAGLLHAGQLLKAQVRLLLEAANVSLEGRKPDAGGPEPNFVRHHLIATLALAAPDIIGKRATTTPKGPFLGLLNDVFIACGLPTDGLEKANQRTLATLRKATGSGRKANKLSKIHP